MDDSNPLDYRRFIAEALKARGMQQRDLADALGRAPSAISLMLSGQRSLDPELVEPIAAALRLGADEAGYFAALVDLESRSPRARRNAWATVAATQRHRAEAGLSVALAAAAERPSFATIVELASCDGFRPEAAWIAGTLLPPITVEEAQEALATAVTLGLLVPNDEGGLSRAADTDVAWSPSEVKSAPQARSTAELHRAAMALAAGCFERSRHNERHVSTTVFRVTEEQFARIRARLREVEREIVVIASESAEPANRVYQLSVQLFPVTLFSDSTADHSMLVSNQGDPPDIEPDTTE